MASHRKTLKTLCRASGALPIRGEVVVTLPLPQQLGEVIRTAEQGNGSLRQAGLFQTPPAQQRLASPLCSPCPELGFCRMAGSTLFSDMAKRRNLKKEKQERNRAYARRFKKRGGHDGRGEGAGNGVTGTASNGGAAD